MLLVLRLWALQVLNTRTFAAQAASNHEKQVVVRAPRGEILDRKGRVLVRNRVAYELDLDPGAVRDSARRHSCSCASPPCSTSPPRPLWERVDRQLRQDPVAPVTLATDIDVKLKWYLQENPSIFHGLSVAQVPLRFYPYRTLGAHIYGQLSEIGPNSCWIRASMTTTAATSSARAGSSGATTHSCAAPTASTPSRSMHSASRPAPCATSRRPCRAQRSPHDRPRHPAGGRAGAREGRARSGLGRRRRGRDRRHRPEDRRDPGAGLLSRRSTPNWFISFRKPKFKRQLTRITRESGTPAHFPLLDRAIAGRYPAASTFKPFVAIAAVKERRITPDELLPCTPRAATTTSRSTTGTRRSTGTST